MLPGSVDVRPLKRLAVRLLEDGSVFRKVITQEEDTIAAADYCAKLGTWLAILKEEFSAGTRLAQDGEA